MGKPLFNWLSRRISYSFAIAVFSVAGGQFSALVGFLFIVMITDLSAERLWLHFWVLVVGVSIATLAHYTLFGMLCPLGRRWELPKLRRLNDWISGETVDESVSTDELVRITHTLEWLPITNRRLAILLGSLVMLAEIGVGLQSSSATDIARFLLGGSIAIVMYAIFVTTVTELVTRTVLGRARRLLALRAAWQGPSRQAALTTKLTLFVGLIGLGLLAIVSIFMLRPGVVRSHGTVLVFYGLVLGVVALMSAMIFHAIIRPLQEIEHAATHLVTAQRAELFSGSTNREFITLAHRVYEAAQQIVGYRTELQEWAQTLEHRVTERTAELEMQNAELDAFAHTVAHDLKNPLSAMIASSSMLEICLNSMPQEKVADTLQRITQTGYKMNNIINELMLLSSVRKMEDVDANPLDMGSIVTEAQTRLRDILQENQVEIVAPGEWPVVLGYGPWIEEVWANYISNAAKYGGRPDEGVLPTVELGFDAPNGSVASNAHVRFWVRDNGPGLTPEEQVEVFTPFTRLHQVRAEGHGLGLSIVRRIISRLGGEVGVESSFGQGSQFYFTLPTAIVGSD